VLKHMRNWSFDTVEREVRANMVYRMFTRVGRMIPLVQQVMQQTKARIFKNDLHAPDKLVSLFETATQIIRKGKSAKPTEFGTHQNPRVGKPNHYAL